MKFQTRNYYLLQKEEIMLSVVDTPRQKVWEEKNQELKVSATPDINSSPDKTSIQKQIFRSTSRQVLKSKYLRDCVISSM